MARLLRPGHREAHVGEQSAVPSLADVALRLVVGRNAGCSDDVQADLLAEPLQLRCPHVPNCAPVRWIRSPRVKAIRIHEDGGPEGLRYDDAPGPTVGPGDVLVSVRAASRNRLDVWVRRGLPSVPKPRILGADGAGIVAGLGEGVVGLEEGQRIVINPG